MYKALLLGVIVSKPYGDNSRYDFVVDNGRRFLGLQVKSTSARVTENLYVVNMERREMGRTLLYREGEVDFLAIYVVPEERWYIIPRAAIGKWTQVTLHKKVGGKLDRFGIYIDAWEQLRE